jgi:hypothetical protein
VLTPRDSLNDGSAAGELLRESCDRKMELTLQSFGNRLTADVDLDPVWCDGSKRKKTICMSHFTLLLRVMGSRGANKAAQSREMPIRKREICDCKAGGNTCPHSQAAYPKGPYRLRR